MKQRVVVQAIIQRDNKVLLLRRSQGRPGVVGKYELPGGTLDDNEQPDDAVRRHLKNDAGLIATNIQLTDALTMTNREEGDIQHVLIVYGVSDITFETALDLGTSYDKYDWIKLSEIHQKDLRDSATYLLKIESNNNPVNITDNLLNQNDDNKSTDSKKVIIYSDGGSRGNPGPSAAAFVILDSNEQVIDQGGGYLGITTNNQAEYHGVLLGLERAIELKINHIDFRVDSMLVSNQLKGVYKIKNRELWPINERILSLIGQFQSVKFTHVPRELNQMADSLVNKLLDEHKNESV